MNTCQKCRYFQPDVGYNTHKLTGYGHCMRYPSVPVTNTHPTHGTYTIFERPVMKYNDTCGEWRTKEGPWT